jgi:hypothetical protein
MITTTLAERYAVRMLARNGIAAICETHVAGAAPYGLVNMDVATTLIKIAEAAEREWFTRCAAIAED